MRIATPKRQITQIGQSFVHLIIMAAYTNQAVKVPLKDLEDPLKRGKLHLQDFRKVKKHNEIVWNQTIENSEAGQSFEGNGKKKLNCSEGKG